MSGRRRLVRGSRIVAAVASFLVLLGSGYGWAEYRSFASGVRQVDALGSSGPDQDGAAQNILLVGDDTGRPTPAKRLLAQLCTQEDGGCTNTDTHDGAAHPGRRRAASVVSSRATRGSTSRAQARGRSTPRSRSAPRTAEATPAG